MIIDILGGRYQQCGKRIDGLDFIQHPPTRDAFAFFSVTGRDILFTPSADAVVALPNPPGVDHATWCVCDPHSLSTDILCEESPATTYKAYLLFGSRCTPPITGPFVVSEFVEGESEARSSGMSWVASASVSSSPCTGKGMSFQLHTPHKGK